MVIVMLMSLVKVVLDADGDCDADVVSQGGP